MRSRKQRVVLNGQVLSLADVNAWVCRGSTMTLLPFLMYINGLIDDLSIANLFADDISLFSIVRNVNIKNFVKSLENEFQYLSN